MALTPIEEFDATAALQRAEHVLKLEIAAALPIYPDHVHDAAGKRSYRCFATYKASSFYAAVGMVFAFEETAPWETWNGGGTRYIERCDIPIKENSKCRENPILHSEGEPYLYLSNSCGHGTEGRFVLYTHAAGRPVGIWITFPAPWPVRLLTHDRNTFHYETHRRVTTREYPTLPGASRQTMGVGDVSGAAYYFWGNWPDFEAFVATEGGA